MRVSTRESVVKAGNNINNSICQIPGEELLDAPGNRFVVTVHDTVQCVEKGNGSYARKRGRSKGSKN